MSKAVVDFGANTTGFNRGLDDMRSKVKGWSSDVGKSIAGAFAAGAALSFAKNFMDDMARINDLSDRLGVSTDAIQRLGHVAEMSGTDLETTIKTLGKLTIAAGKSGEEFEKLGINAGEFAAASPEAQVILLAGAFDRANGDVQKMNDLMALLGSRGQEIMPMLTMGADEMAAALAGTSVVSAQAVEAMALLDDSIVELGQNAKVWLGGVVEWIQSIATAGAAVVAMFSEGGSFEGNYARLKEIQANDADVKANRKERAVKAKGALTTDAEGKATGQDGDKTAAAAKALEEEMTRLARSRMDDEQKITDLKREQAELAAAAQDKSKSDAERLGAAREVLQVQQEIEAIQKRINDAAAKADEEAEKAMQEFYDGEAAAEEEADADAAAAIDEFYDEEAKAAEESGALDKMRPSVVSSSLAAIGGGGGSYFSSGQNPALVEAKKQTSLLERIASNTGGGSTGTVNPF